MRDYADIAADYARRVTLGEILACALVRKACARHLEDLSRQESKDFPYRFDERAAAKACGFVELMPHTKGVWAGRGERLRLEPWQVFILASVFGWVRKSDGLRRFRKVYIEVPRKNGKSALSAPVGLYMMAADGEHGAEVYSGATTEQQAWEVFRPAKIMAERTPEFLEAFGVEVMASNISIPANGSRFKPIIGKPGDGASPSCAIVDEYHEHDTDELYDTMLTGMGARRQPLMWVITTAGADIAGPCYALRSDVVRMLEGTAQDDTLFGIVYTVDEGVDWTSEDALRMANPNYGVSVGDEFLREQIRDAVQNARKQNVVKTKHLNVWVTARAAFLNMERFNQAADAGLREEDFEGEACWMGLDLASKIDIACVSKLFYRDGKWYVFVRSYLPEARVQDPEKRHYQEWAHGGYLTVTEGDVIDYERIQTDIERDAKRFRITALGYDPYSATQMAQNLQKAGLNVIEVPQRVQQLSEPMKEIEAIILDGRLAHDGNPCTAWQFSNVTAKVDANDNVFPRKEQPHSKIDAFVATVIAKRVSMIPAADTASIYASRGVRGL